MFRVEDDDDMHHHARHQQEDQQQVPDQHVASLAKYVECAKKVKEQTKKKSEAKQQIEDTMTKNNQKILHYDGVFFVREDSKKTKAPLTKEFVKKVLVGFFRSKNHDLSPELVQEFDVYLEKKQEQFAQEKKPRVVCKNKRPIDEYF